MVTRHAFAAAVMLAALCGGCTSNLVNPAVPPPGSDALQEGYVNGCASGYSDAGREGWGTRYWRDGARYASSPDYRSGWDQGHKACYDDEIRTPHMMGATRF